MYLDSTVKLEVETSSTAELDWEASWVDSSGANASDVIPGQDGGTISSAASTTLIPAPSASRYRAVKSLSFRNRHASTSNTIILQKDNGGTDREILKVVLAAGESLLFEEKAGWQYLDANGVPKITNNATTAAQGDMESGTSNLLFVTPLNFNWHPGACKAWANLGLTGNVIGGWNVPSAADTGTGVVTLTIGTDFSGTGWAAIATIEFNSTTLAQSCTADSKAAGAVVLRSVVEAGSSADPVSAWGFAAFGDQA